MARKLKEQIDYGTTPERMDPNLERKLASPEGMYATNPAMKKGVEDVQRLVSKRFQKVADKLRQVTGIEDLSSRQVQGMVYQEMMRKLPNIMRIEAAHRDELIDLAKEASLDEAEVPANWYPTSRLSLDLLGLEGEHKDGHCDEPKPQAQKQPAIRRLTLQTVAEASQLRLLLARQKCLNR